VFNNPVKILSLDSTIFQNSKEFFLVHSTHPLNAHLAEFLLSKPVFLSELKPEFCYAL
jgi:hypothetical protein